MSTFLQDLRFGLRMLAGRPAFTGVAVLVLALGIGANSAMFSMVNALLLRPLAAERVPGQLVGLYSRDRTRPDQYRAFSYPNYADIREENRVFSSLLAEGIGLVGIEEGESTKRAMAMTVSSNFFEALGEPLLTGRGFTLEEERPGSEPMVAVVSHGFWRSRGSDPQLLGDTIRVNGRHFTVVGITSKGFTGSTVMLAPEVYVPLGAYELIVNDLFNEGSEHTRLADRENHSLVLIGRLKPGLGVAAATAQLEALGRHLEEAHPAINENQTLLVHELQRLGISTAPGDDGPLATVLLLLQAMAGIVLLIACLNLANMMLAHASARRREIGVRLALGAGAGRVVRQLMTEGLILSFAGGAVGLLFAFWSTRVLAASLTGAFPIAIEYDGAPDLRVLAATFGFALAATLLFGLWPARRLARTDVVQELKLQVGESAARRRRFSLRDALVVGQVALSLALLTAAGLFVRSAIDASGAEPGYEFRNGLVASIDPGLSGYDEDQGRRFYQRLLGEVRTLPGVRAASLATLISYGEVSDSERVRRVGTSGEEGRSSAISNIVGADYFAALGLPLLRGREFSEAEESSPEGARVAIVDEPLAERLFPGEDPLGRQILFTNADETSRGDPMQIVGVVPGLRHDLYDREPVAHVYTPFGQHYRSWMTLHVKHAGGGAEVALLRSVRGAIRDADDRVPVLWLRTLEEYREASLWLWLARAGAQLFATFGGLALFLAVVGIYGVMAYLVSLRTREVGVRMALGASRADVLWLVLRDSLRLTGIGVAIGLGLAGLVAAAVGGLVYGSSPFDPVVFTGAMVVLVGSAAAATLVPARRATRIEPFVALRVD